MMILNCDGDVELVNNEAAQILTGESLIVEERISEFLKEVGLKDLAIKACQDSSSSNGVLEFKSHLCGANIRAKWNVVLDSKQLVVGVVIAFEDITGSISEEAIKTEFLSTISHELRTPIAIVKNCISNMLVGVTGRVNDKSKSYLDKMNYECGRISFLINNMVDMAKIDAGQMPISPTISDVWTLVTTVCEGFTATAQLKNVMLSWEMVENLPIVELDQDRIQQVLWNLINNAIKFTPDGGRVIVRASVKDGNVIFEVEDNGMGIAPEQKTAIFKKFSQICRQKGAGYNGSGLGLAISKGIIDAHGGEIRVESEQGEGSKFVITIPQRREKIDFVLENTDFGR